MKREELIMLDAKRLSTTPQLYAEVNAYQYALASGTWMLLLSRVDEMVMGTPKSLLRGTFESMLNTMTLLECIRFAVDAADFVISNYLNDPEIAEGLANHQPVTSYAMGKTIVDNTLISQFVADVVSFGYLEVPSELLQALRYLKRFSPLCADKLQEETLNGFLDLNKKNKYKRANRWLADEIRATIYELVDVSKFLRILPKATGYITDGSTLDCGSDRGRKCDALIDQMVPPSGGMVEGFHSVSHNANFKAKDHARACTASEASPSKGCPYLQRYCGVCPLRWTDAIHTGDCAPVVEIMPVPKSYKAARIVGMEQIRRSYSMTRVRDALLNSLTPLGRKIIDLSTQEPNRIGAFLASIAGDYTTTDLSAASDSISVYVAEQVFPPELYHVFAAFRAQWLVIVKEKEWQGDTPIWWDYQYRYNYIWQTSGNVLTFPTMMLILAAASLIAQRLTQSRRFTRIYGDDLEVPQEYATTMNEFLDNLGFVINGDKTFDTTGPGYRESCGVEFVAGCETTTLYWPRKEVKDSAESLPLVLDLQHKLYSLGCDTSEVMKLIRRGVKDTEFAKMLQEVTFMQPNDETGFCWWADYNAFTLIRDENDLKRVGDVKDYQVHTEAYLTKRSKKHAATIGETQLAYYQYLQSGPMYSDPLLELLGCSESRIPKKIQSDEYVIRYRLR